MPLIDTLALKTNLLNGGMPEPQATAIVDALAADADVGQLATKADLADVRMEIADVRAEVADVRTEVESLRGDVKALNAKVNIVLAFNTPLLVAVLAMLWRMFFSGAG